MLAPPVAENETFHLSTLHFLYSSKLCLASFILCLACRVFSRILRKLCNLVNLGWKQERKESNPKIWAASIAFSTSEDRGNKAKINKKTNKNKRYRMAKRPLIPEAEPSGGHKGISRAWLKETVRKRLSCGNQQPLHQDGGCRGRLVNRIAPTFYHAIVKIRTRVILPQKTQEKTRTSVKNERKTFGRREYFAQVLVHVEFRPQH